MNVKLKRESRLLIMAITSVAYLFLAWICFSSSDGSTGYV